jgi:metal-responsive CopG/Arc/MetJ family transcriptional regulator
MAKSVKYEVYIPTGMVAEVEQYCNEHSMSGSEAFREAMKNELESGGYL